MSKEKEKQVIPPYVPYRTFQNFLEGLDPVPPVIDNAVLKTMGGALRSQLLGALRYLQLIDTGGKTRDALKVLVKAKGEARAKELRNLLTDAYPFLFQPDPNGFSLEEGTNPQFLDKFRELGASGDTVRRCGKFFLDAAKEAGITISPYIKPETATRTKSESGKSIRRPPARKARRDSSIENSGDEILPSKWYTTFKSAFGLLPTNFDKDGKAHWKKSDRDSFLVLITATLDAYAKVDAKE